MKPRTGVVSVKIEFGSTATTKTKTNSQLKLKKIQ